jgi:hypothetical protein
MEEPGPPTEDLRDLRYRHHQARRRARNPARGESRRARYRVLIQRYVHVVGAIVLVVLAWREIERLFGL